MFPSTRLALLAALAASVSAQTLTLVNNCTYEVDPGFYPAVWVERAGVKTGGIALVAGQTLDVGFPANYTGAVWGRTGCDAAFRTCKTGACAGGLNCTAPARSAGASGPTLAGFALDGRDARDSYGASTAEGYNVPVMVVPTSGCSTASVRCGPHGSGAGCGQTASCPTGTSYTVQFC